MNQEFRLPARIEAILVDPQSTAPVVVLRLPESGRVFVLWVGIFEANAIAIELEKVVAPRPMTHDLMRNTIDALSARVTQVGITGFLENVLFATVFLQLEGQEIHLDARPSDALALALRCRVPVFVKRSVALTVGTFASVEDWLRSMSEEAQ